MHNSVLKNRNYNFLQKANRYHSSHPTHCNPTDCSVPGSPVLHYLLEFTQICVHWVDDALQPSHPLLSPSPPALNLSQRELALHIRWPKYCSFSFTRVDFVLSGLISFSIDWFDLAVQGTLKSLLQHHSSKASILWPSGFFMVQVTHPYMTTRKTIAVTTQTFVSKVMSLLFNMLSRFVIAFLPRNNYLLISWLQSHSTVILETKKVKSVINSTFLPSLSNEVMGPDAMISSVCNTRVSQVNEGWTTSFGLEIDPSWEMIWKGGKLTMRRLGLPYS